MYVALVWAWLTKIMKGILLQLIFICLTLIYIQTLQNRFAITYETVKLCLKLNGRMATLLR